MGNILAVAQGAISELLRLNRLYKDILHRISQSPGIPCPNPTNSFWMHPPSDIANYLPEIIPTTADIVIIGSGITGLAVAQELLKRTRSTDDNDNGDESGPLKVVLIEAREICSGATGRNGGHVWPTLFDEYVAMKEKFGGPSAQRMVRFRSMHTKAYREMATDAGILEECQFRDVEAIEASLDPKVWQNRKRKFEEWKQDMPEDASSWTLYDRHEAIEKFRLSKACQGAIAGPAAGIFPYRFVSSLLSKLVYQYPEDFVLLSNTSCTDILQPTDTVPSHYTVVTSRGTIKTPCVVHATNAFISHLLPTLRQKILPIRATMSAQQPGQTLHKSTLNGSRSYSFIGSTMGFDYLTQLPTADHELMFGGGIGHSGNEGMNEVGISDDSDVESGVAAYLSGALPVIFGFEHWGQEAAPKEDRSKFEPEWMHAGRVKSVWSGIIATSVDGLPWVGGVPSGLTERRSPKSTSSPPSKKEESQVFQPTGEWVSAGYSGEGMASALLCGKALVSMMLETEESDRLFDWFPVEMKFTKTRWRKSRVQDLLDSDWGH